MKRSGSIGGTSGSATILIQRSVSLGEEADTKTRQHRTVRLLAPLAADMRSSRMAAGRAGDDELVFPARTAGHGRRRRTSPGAGERSIEGMSAAGIAHARPYDLRHSFASLLLHEGQSVIYVARQLGA